MTSILIIDDDPQMRHAMDRVLRAAGHDTIDAKNGRVGMKLFRARRPGLVVTDIFMPDQEGIETILALRREAPEVPIIAVSGGTLWGGVDFLDIAQKFGVAAILKKPFRPAELLAAVDKALLQPAPPETAA